MGATLSRSVALAALLIAPLLALGGCSSSVSMVGMWSASDGSVDKIINDNGSCTGMYYNGTAVLDIGGGETCTLSSKPDSDGNYSLIVSQPPNSATYPVKFDGDTMTISLGGTDTVTLTRK